MWDILYTSSGSISWKGMFMHRYIMFFMLGALLLPSAVAVVAVVAVAQFYDSVFVSFDCAVSLTSPLLVLAGLLLSQDPHRNRPRI